MLPSRRIALLLALPLALAGCVAPGLTSTASLPDLPVLGEVHLLEEGGFEMEVPIHVYLVGFPAETAAQVQAALEATPIDHADGSMPTTFPPDPADPTATPLTTWHAARAPTQPIAQFNVHDMDDAFDAAFLAAAKGWAVPDAEKQFDANAAEVYLADALEAEGVTLDRSNPVFVIVHASELGEHGWRHTFTHGYLDHVRIFGEREPLTIFDVSAAEDPYVVVESMSPTAIVFRTAFGPTPTQPYDHPIEASGADAVDTLALLVEHAAHYRFLKGPIYPISTKPCHHITLLYAIETAAATEALPGYVKAADLVDAARIEGYFENLTGDEVTAELKTLMLPQDDPALEAMVRHAGSLGTLDMLRWYLSENFDAYVTPQEGCEEYLSLLVFGDAATVGAFGGIGTYDVDRDRRISFSLIGEPSRLRSDDLGAAGPLAVESPDRVWDYVVLLYAHETGHLFGQHHPQHLSDSAAELPANSAFEGVYSVMSYQQGDRNSDFGSVDFATWTRGRVGYTVRDAQALELVGTPEFDAALSQLAAGRWADAHLALESLVQQEAHEHPDALPAFHVHGSHPHPWS